MVSVLVQCVPNISEGRRMEVVEAVVIKSGSGQAYTYWIIHPIPTTTAQ
jgi:glutamate formiminotransferase